MNQADLAMLEPASSQANVFELFERQAIANPAAVAVIDDDGATTYGALAGQAEAVSRHLLELKGKMGADLGPATAPAGDNSQNDILQALVALGYSDKEAALSLKSLPAGVGVSEGIKFALKALAK